MRDDAFEATIVVDLSPDEAWEALLHAQDDAEAAATFLLPGFPSFDPTPAPGALATELEVDPGKLLRVRKASDPCGGTEIAIVLEAADTGTKISITQSGFGSWLKPVKETMDAHWWEIVADLQLFIERGIRAPAKNWGPDVGGLLTQTPTGLTLRHVVPDGYFARAGLLDEDLLVAFRGVRIFNIQQLWTIQALSLAGEEVEVIWAHGNELRSCSEKL